MAIAPTGAIYKSLSFDNVSSRNYGVYITGEAVYNAPERDVEMITIPGRNGAFALDNGRFENIEVTYPAGIFADNETDFAAAVSDFRNFLCSKRGYCRLMDEYNPNEYRMAVYKSGLEVEPAQLRAGEFEITFECKPQRFLTSGETAVAVVSGGAITNPTLFPSSPMLEVKGYGNIAFNGYSINLYNETLGYMKLLDRNWFNPIRPNDADNLLWANLNHSYYNNGDQIDVYYQFATNHSGAAYCDWFYSYDTGLYGLRNETYSGTNVESAWLKTRLIDGVRYYGTAVIMPNVSFIAGTSGSFTTIYSGTFEVWNRNTNLYEETVTATVTLVLTYDGNNRLELSITRAITGDTLNLFTIAGSMGQIQRGAIYVDSSASTLGNPTYIDCDIGDAYMIKNGSYVSLNKNIDLGSDLPELAPGSNSVTFDNTVTQFKIVPRWWKV